MKIGHGTENLGEFGRRVLTCSGIYKRMTMEKPMVDGLSTTAINLGLFVIFLESKFYVVQ